MLHEEKKKPSSFTIPPHVELRAFAKDRLGFEFYHFFFPYILVIRLFLLTPFFFLKKRRRLFLSYIKDCRFQINYLFNMLITTFL